MTRALGNGGLHLFRIAYPVALTLGVALSDGSLQLFRTPRKICLRNANFALN